jgi:hypothetical protein
MDLIHDDVDGELSCLSADNQGVGNTLKRHYETYLLEYEFAHDDVDGEFCLLCHRSLSLSLSLAYCTDAPKTVRLADNLSLHVKQ